MVYLSGVVYLSVFKVAKMALKFWPSCTACRRHVSLNCLTGYIAWEIYMFCDAAAVSS